MTERKDDRLWGGRFEREPNAHFDAFQRSFAFDRRLLPYEIAVDRAWAKALEPVGIFTATEVKQTLAALDKISKRAQSDPASVHSFGASAEDVHHFVEKALVEELGPLGWKLHTGRSRNELVATDFRLFVIDAAAEIQRVLSALLSTLLGQAKANPGENHGDPTCGGGAEGSERAPRDRCAGDDHNDQKTVTRQPSFTLKMHTKPRLNQ